MCRNMCKPRVRELNGYFRTQTDQQRSSGSRQMSWTYVTKRRELFRAWETLKMGNLKLVMFMLLLITFLTVTATPVGEARGEMDSNGGLPVKRTKRVPGITRLVCSLCGDLKAKLDLAAHQRRKRRFLRREYEKWCSNTDCP
ncbi:uncharacterized protein LOC143289526 [Babylonia areolata]|uniref:uncharacterized protein LOC143289526 n=1 Tax=Babylonia areolata TaxID=304850 RepID=UPI003FD0C0E2